MLAPMLTRRLVALVFPEGLLLLAVVALMHWGAAAPSAAPAVRLYPIVVLAAGVLLCWRFQRGRLLFALLGLAIADRALLWLAPLDSGASHAGPVVVRTVAIMLPASLLALALVGECGALTETGLRRTTVLATEVALLLVVWLLSAAYPERLAEALDLTFLPNELVDWLPLGQPAAVAALLAITALVARTLWRPDPEARGFLWAAIASVIAVSVGPAHGRATVHFAGAGLVLVVATVESAYAMAYRDELTGLPGRRALNEALLRMDGIYTVAMVDVDHFKKFNDAHGHDSGDQVLRLVASRLGRVEGGGRAFRYGGEEFTLLFPGKTVGDCAPHLEARRAAVASSAFTVRGQSRAKAASTFGRSRSVGAKQLRVTVSIGAAQARESATPDDVVAAADKALYRAKEDGRNRVAV